jgi:predicted nucleotidyltransferase component of viral defense system
MAKEIRNIGASVRARLLQLSKANGQSFELVLTRFALERLLYRIGRSQHSDRFVLKGAMLMMSWFDDPHRGTRDVDLLGFGDPSPDAMVKVFQDILTLQFSDGVEFDPGSLRVDRFREELDYGGLRLRAGATIGGARIGVTIDIGFGDAIEPGIEFLDYPAMLDFPHPSLRAYARETVIAEKFQAMVALGRTNSRMKDFYDIWILSRSFTFEDDRLARAIAATFARRSTAIPNDLPDALTPEFAADEQKQRQWRAFIRDVARQPGDLETVVQDLAAFLMPHAMRAIQN